VIACLGWGSLIWDPRDLRLRRPPKWLEDGPLLPVEFAHKSKNGRMTLVLLREGPAVPTLWAEMSVETLQDARQSLAMREGCNVNAIGSWPGEAATFSHIEAIGAWAASKRLDGVVWTALGPKFDNACSVAAAAQVVDYLRSLSGEPRYLAEEYIRKTPAQVRTPYRAVIESELGWTP
jgi:hypothetical protein